eukprot:gene6731-13630_t
MYSTLFIKLLLVKTIWASSNDFYSIVIDGGSTGSRAFVYHFFYENGERKVIGIEGQKVSPGISSFVTSPKDAGNYLAPVLEHCKTVIPLQFHNKTAVHFKATAGMRLLAEQDQNIILDALVEGLNDHPEVPFIISRDYFGIIDGRYEAYYAVLASNFIIGRLDTSLKPVQGLPMVGALDMGGSSTQLVFHTGTPPGEVVDVDHFWSYSWLSYGVEAVKERNNHVIVIANPCTALDHEETFGEYILRGTGASYECEKIIKEVLWPQGTLEHPSVEGLEFFGMSVYFYALDCIRHLGTVDLPSWPNPTIDEVQDAVHDFCSRPWSDLQQLQDGHAYTQADQMAHRCLQTLYLGILLEDAFGFDGSHRGITLALEVGGNEVQWTFGFALAELLPALETEKHTATSNALGSDNNNNNDGRPSETVSQDSGLDGIATTTTTTSIPTPQVMEALEDNFIKLQHEHIEHQHQHQLHANIPTFGESVISQESESSASSGSGSDESSITIEKYKSVLNWKFIQKLKASLSNLWTVFIGLITLRNVKAH